MLVFAKVRRYVVPTAVIALALADAVGYHLINQNLNESVSLSRELVEEAEGSETAQPTAFTSLESISKSPPLLAEESGADETLTATPSAAVRVAIEPPLGADDVTHTQDRDSPLLARATELDRTRAAPPYQRKSKVAFFQTFASISSATRDLVLPSSGGPNGTVGNDDCTGTCIVSVDDVVPAQTVTNQDSLSVPVTSKQASELPASEPISAEPELEHRVPLDSGSPASSPVEAAKQIPPVPLGNEVTVVGQERRSGLTSDRLAITAKNASSITKAGGSTGTTSFDKTAESYNEWTLANPVRTATLPMRLQTISLDQHGPIAPTAVNNRAGSIGSQPVVKQRSFPLLVQTANTNHSLNSVASLAFDHQSATAAPRQVETDWAQPEPSQDTVGVTLRDILIALQPLMDSDEFASLINSKNSATVASLKMLRRAGISVQFERETPRVMLI